MLIGRGLTASLFLMAVSAFVPRAAAQIVVHDLAKLSSEQIDLLPAVEVAASYASSTAAAGARDAAIRDAVATFNANVRYQLAALYYPIDLSGADGSLADRNAVEQVKAFESTLDRGTVRKFTPDGILNFAELREIDHIYELARTLPVISMENDVSVFQFGQGDYGTVRATGTWVMLNEQIAFPLNLATITCDKIEGSCEVREVDISAPSEKGLATSSDGQYMLYSGVPNYFNVTRWSGSVVEARSLAPIGEPECRFTTLTINSETKTVTQITQDGETKCTVVGTAKLERLGAPRVTVMRSPKESFSAYFDQLYQAVEQHYGPLAQTIYHRPYLPKKY